MLRYIGSLMLGAALLAPAIASAQDRDRYDRRDAPRYYDPYRRDYHTWNNGESDWYRRWLRERPMEYREFARLNRRQQADYWRWRHEREEHEHDRR